jgi:hypothetical protein
LTPFKLIQITFAALAFEGKKKQTRREKFLLEMEAVVPWEALLAEIEPYYPTSGRRGRPPMPLRLLWKTCTTPPMQSSDVNAMRYSGWEFIWADPLPLAWYPPRLPAGILARSGAID